MFKSSSGLTATTKTTTSYTSAGLALGVSVNTSATVKDSNKLNKHHADNYDNEHYLIDEDHSDDNNGGGARGDGEECGGEATTEEGIVGGVGCED